MAIGNIVQYTKYYYLFPLSNAASCTRSAMDLVCILCVTLARSASTVLRLIPSFCEIALLDISATTRRMISVSREVGRARRALISWQRVCSRIACHVECRLRVRLRRSPGVPPTSGAGGEADEIGAKVDIGARTAAIEGKADVSATWPRLPVLARIGSILSPALPGHEPG